MGDGPPSLSDLAHGKLAHEKATPAPPQQETLGQQTQDTLDVAHANAPQQYEDYAKYSGLYNRVDLQNMKDMLPQLKDINNQMSDYSYGQMKQYNPELYASLDKLDNFNNTGLSATLTQQAQDQLNSGGALSAQDIRDAQQSARAGSEARGLSGTNGSLITEAMNTDAMKRQRLQQAQNFAGGVNQQNLGALQAGIGARQAVAYNPSTQTFQGAQNALGQSNQNVSGMFNPYNSYAQDYYNTGFNAASSNYNSAQNNQAAQRSGMMQAGAGVGGALLIAF